MTTKTLRTSILLASLLAIGGFASAQTAATAKGDGTDNKVKAEAMATTGSDKTRADVKAEAKADNKSMPKNKSGEGADLAGKPNPAGDVKARADVKAEAKMPLKTGEGIDKGTGEVQTKAMSKKRRKAASMAS